MPYGSETKFYKDGDVAVRKSNYYPGGSNSSTTHFYDTFVKEYWFRTGENNPKPKVTYVPDPTPKAFRRVLVRYKRGPRLPYKTFVKSLNRWVWARERIAVYRMKAIKSKQRRVEYPPLLSHKLRYVSSTFEPYGDGVLIASVGNDYRREYTGDTWSPFVGWDGYEVGLYPGSVSDGRFDDALIRVDQRAIPKLYEKVKDSQVNFGQMIAEREQTAGLLRDGFLRLVTAVLAAKKLNFAKAAKALFPTNTKALANDVLAYQFGIVPLVSDIQDVVSQLADMKPFHDDVRVREVENLPPQIILRRRRGGVTTTVVSRGYVHVKYRVRVRLSSPFSNLAAKLGISDVASLGWELMPWSFVADWFIPIGSYIASLTAFAGIDLIQCTKTVAISRRTECYQTFQGTDGDGYTWTSAVQGWVQKDFQVSRDNIPMPDFPLFQLKDNPFTKNHIIDALALVRQLFR